MSDNIVFYTVEEGEDAKKSFSVYADINEYFETNNIRRRLRLMARASLSLRWSRPRTKVGRARR